VGQDPERHGRQADATIPSGQQHEVTLVQVAGGLAVPAVVEIPDVLVLKHVGVFLGLRR
jgi:hypothetical protein